MDLCPGSIATILGLALSIHLADHAMAKSLAVEKRIEYSELMGLLNLKGSTPGRSRERSEAQRCLVTWKRSRRQVEAEQGEGSSPLTCHSICWGVGATWLCGPPTGPSIPTKTAW